MLCVPLHDSSDIFSYFFCVRSYRSALPLLQKSHMSPHNVSHPSSVSSSTNLTKRGWRGGWGSTKQISPTPAAFRSSDFLAKMSYKTQIKRHIAQLQMLVMSHQASPLIMNCCDVVGEFLTASKPSSIYLSDEFQTSLHCNWFKTNGSKNRVGV